MQEDFMKIYSPAKVNLCLDILRRDVSGFHEIQTVYQEIPEFFDEIELRETPRWITVECENPDVPLDHTNTAYKGAKAMQEHFRINRGIEIKIHKKIPVFSGLGGGSSNAATVMKALNELWNIHAPLAELIKLSHQISMDAAFFFYGGTAFGTHFGEKITLLPPLPKDLKIEIIDTGVKISSHDAYSWIDLSQCGKNIDKTKKLIEGLHEKNSQKILENLHNDFEPFIFGKFPILIKHTEQNYKKTGLRPVLSGSGGALFSILNPFKTQTGS